MRDFVHYKSSSKWVSTRTIYYIYRVYRAIEPVRAAFAHSPEKCKFSVTRTSGITGQYRDRVRKAGNFSQWHTDPCRNGHYRKSTVVDLAVREPLSRLHVTVGRNASQIVAGRIRHDGFALIDSCRIACRPDPGQ